MDSTQTPERLEQLREAFAPLRARVLDDLIGSRLRADDLKARPGDCQVLRVYPAEGESLILKMWNRPGLRGALRRWTRTAPHQREVASLERLWCMGLPVPAPLGCERLRRPGLPYTDALMLEDLGDCSIALEWVKQQVAEGKQSEAEEFLAGVVDLTVAMVEAGVIDSDHSFFNVVARPDGRPARLDLEIAGLHSDDEAYGKMLGRLIATLVFAVQPDTALVAPFAASLRERLDPAAPVLAIAARQVRGMLDHQRDRGGPDTRFELGWAAGA